MKTQKGSVGVIAAIIIGAIIIGGGVFWGLSKKTTSKESYQQDQKESTVAQQENTQPGAQVENVEFPWSQYESTKNIQGRTTASKEIAGKVTLGGYSNIDLIIAKDAEIGGGSKVDTIIGFETVNIAAGSKIGTVYALATTKVLVGRTATVGKTTILSKTELVNLAKSKAGIGASTAPAKAPSATTQTTSTTANTGSAQTTSNTADYSGTYNGTFKPSVFTGPTCPNASFSLTVSSGGTFQGTVVTETQQVYYGGGNVDSNGNMTGTWSIGGSKFYLNGKITGNTGSGYFDDKGACKGPFTMSK